MRRMPCGTKCVLGSFLTGVRFFFSRFAEISHKREQNAASPSTVMFHEAATLVHPIELSKAVDRAKGILLIVLLEVPCLLEGRPYLASAAMDNLSRDKAIHDKKIAGDYVLNLADVGESALSTGRRELS